MIINTNTTIATVLKHKPDALDAIIGINPRFSKLRNPLLRKLMAGRTTLGMASKIGGCEVTAFYKALAPLGFEIDAETQAPPVEQTAMPAFMVGIEPGSIIELDVRPVIDAGKDPLEMIMKKLATLATGQTLKVINSFEPAPLVLLLEKRGFTAYVNRVDDQLVETFFYKPLDTLSTNLAIPADASTGWEDVLLRFNNRIQTIDVRHLEMPQPMLTILAALESLPVETALLVHHKRIPVFLLPELSDRDFEYRIQEPPDGSVNMIIYKA